MGEDPKPHRNFQEQLALLKARGLDVGDHKSAVAALKRIGYYRLLDTFILFARNFLPPWAAPQLNPGPIISLTALASLPPWNCMTLTASFAPSCSKLCRFSKSGLPCMSDTLWESDTRLVT